MLQGVRTSLNPAETLVPEITSRSAWGDIYIAERLKDAVGPGIIRTGQPKWLSRSKARGEYRRVRGPGFLSPAGDNAPVVCRTDAMTGRDRLVVRLKLPSIHVAAS